MKKILMALFAFAVAASVATAGIGISWATQNWGEYHVGGGAILAANDVLWQLIYAGVDNQADPIHNDGVVSPMDPAAWVANNYLRPGGDDQLLASRIIPMGGGTAADGTIWDEWLMGVIGTADPVFQDLSWTTAGFVYQRVFESSTPLSGSTYFYQTGLLALDTTFAGGTSTPQDFFVDPAGGPLIPNLQPYAVPEPATMGLLGLGALVMAIRRRRA
ncbi:MAG TPA: PEP-CTERM sorting domain-containing protein [Kiritimatiellia bacterium]|nr:PEP-CTERM sorting domain-containing protein [Kiritimatiellia bacterium]